MNRNNHLPTTITVIVLLATCAAFVPAVVSAGPTLGIYTDTDSYGVGDTITVSLSGQNFDYGMSVDIYIGLLMPDGETYTLVSAGWSEYLDPWIRDIYIPNPFDMPKTDFMWISLPSNLPPITAEGEYYFAAGLTYPDTFEFVSDISFAQFFYGETEGTGIFVSAESGDDGNDGTQLLPYKTITHALASVVASELNPVTINAGPGVYSASTNGETFPLYMKSYVSLKGHGRQMSTLDAEFDAPHVVYFDNVHNCTLEGFTITGGSALDGDVDDCGGGIYIEGTTPQIIDNEIINNDAEKGGGIYCRESEASIEGNMIVDNVAIKGGAIFCYAGSQTISGNDISINYADHGGGIFFDGYSAAAVEGNSIVSNFSGGKGGGIACVNASYPSIVGNVISENEAEYGGGVSCHDGGTPGIEDNWIQDNAAYNGGGIYSEGSAPRALNNLLTGNFASVYSGGIYATGQSTPIFVNCTIVENDAEYGAGGAVSAAGCILTLENCILWGNSGAEASTRVGTIAMTYSDVEGGYSGVGNLGADPGFVEGPLGFYYLDSSSQCVDAGSRTAAEAGLDGMTTQADGTLDTGTVDIGFHYVVE